MRRAEPREGGHHVDTVLAGLVTGARYQKQWLGAFADRYLNLHLSDALVPVARQASATGSRPGT